MFEKLVQRFQCVSFSLILIDFKSKLPRVLMYWPVLQELYKIYLYTKERKKSNLTRRKQNSITCRRFIG